MAVRGNKREKSQKLLVVVSYVLLMITAFSTEIMAEHRFHANRHEWYTHTF
jgi:hypothetical protein